MDDALHAIAEPHRRRIIQLLWSAELPAGQIAQAFSDITRPAGSQHIRVLCEAGLLRERRQGTRRLYRTRREQIQSLRAQLDAFWTERLASLKVAVEREARRSRR